MEKSLKNGDVVYRLKHNSFFSKAVAWFTRSKNERPTRAVHVAMIIFYAGEFYVIEAVSRVKITPFKEWAKDKEFSVWRKKDLTVSERIDLRDEALKYKGCFYGFWKLFLHAFDAFISKIWYKEVFLLRRLQFIDRYPICSWLVAYTYYNALKYSFGTIPKLTDPDSMNDYTRKSEDFHLVLIKRG
jgi:hypothetical protein